MLTLFHTGSIVAPVGFFKIIPPKKTIFVSNLLDFKSNLFTNNNWKFEVAKVTGSFPILRFAKVTFQNLSILAQIKWRHKAFLWRTALTWAFYDSYSKKNKN